MALSEHDLARLGSIVAPARHGISVTSCQKHHCKYDGDVYFYGTRIERLLVLVYRYGTLYEYSTDVD